MVCCSETGKKWGVPTEERVNSSKLKKFPMGSNFSFSSKGSESLGGTGGEGIWRRLVM